MAAGPGTPTYAACEGLLQTLPEAMSTSTYEAVLRNKGVSLGQDVEEFEVTIPIIPFEELIFPGAASTFTVPQKALREDLASNKVCWYADFKKDLWRFTQNSNPLVALWASHPLHPIGRRERYMITFVQVLFVMMISTSVPRAKHCFRGGFEGCSAQQEFIYDPKYDVYANGAFCCLTERMGLQWFLKTFGLAFGGALYAMVANIAFGQLLFQAGANCCCVQRHKRYRVYCESLGHLIILGIGGLLCWPLPKFVQYCIDKHQVGFVLSTFVVGKIGSMIATSIFQTIIWYICWRWQCPMDADGSLWGVDLAPTKTSDQDCEDSGFNVTALDYWLYVRGKPP